MVPFVPSAGIHPVGQAERLKAITAQFGVPAHDCKEETVFVRFVIRVSASFTALTTAFHLATVSGLLEISVLRLYAAYPIERTTRVPKNTKAE